MKDSIGKKGDSHVIPHSQKDRDGPSGVDGAGVHLVRVLGSGTIRDFDGIIPDSAIKAIHMARENGHKVCISTGRTYTRIDKEILDIGFDGIISSSGGYVEYEGECISHRYFTQLAYIELMNDLLLHQCVVEIETGRESYVLSQDMEAYLAIRERMYENLEVAKESVKPPVPIDCCAGCARGGETGGIQQSDVWRGYSCKMGIFFPYCKPERAI